MQARNKRLGPWLAAAQAVGMLLIASNAARAQVSLTTVVELAQKNSTQVRLAQADVRKAAAQVSQAKDVFIPSVSFGSGLPAFPEIGFTGDLPTIWDSKMQSLVFSMQQIRYIQAAHEGVKAAQAALKDTQEQVALDASSDYIELDTVNTELAAAHEQESFTARLVEIEQQRTDAGVDPLSELYHAQLTAAELKLNRLHLEARAVTLAKHLAQLTGLPVGSIAPDHASIPEVPAVTADEKPITLAGIEASGDIARSKMLIAKGDQEHLWWLPEVAFGAQYNRSTQLLNNVGSYFVVPNGKLPADNFSTGFSIKVPIVDFESRAKQRESAAEALRAKVEAEQAQQQDDLQIATLSGNLRELDAQAEVASLKQKIAGEQLKAVMTQLELGNGAAGAPGAPPQLSPQAEQKARIDERQKYVDATEAGLNLEKARLGLLRALGHMQDWLNELHTK